MTVFAFEERIELLLVVLNTCPSEDDTLTLLGLSTHLEIPDTFSKRRLSQLSCARRQEKKGNNFRETSTQHGL